MVKIIDRRAKALGGQNNTRKLSNIKEIAWHYTATTGSNIESHERFWRNKRGWTYGGYHFYIDRDGNIYQNYNLETVTNGVKNHNSRIVNICCEASSADNYTPAQIKARHELTLYLIDLLKLSANVVKQHGEFSGTSTECAGYTKVQMDEFRKQLAEGSAPKVEVKPVTPSKQPSAYTGGSIVDYLVSIKQESTFSNRKKLAREYLGISNYSGTAKQNTDLLNAMRGGVKQKVQPKPKPKTTSKWNYKGGKWTGQVLKVGDYGPAVEDMQRILARHNFYPDKGAKNDGIDSYYGEKTENQVTRFQSMHGLAQDGIAGPATYRKAK